MNPAHIKQLRTSLGLSQEAFARLLGVSFQSMHRWETGKQKPSPLAREKIQQVIDKQITK